jgi:hypothetical protein
VCTTDLTITTEKLVELFAVNNEIDELIIELQLDEQFDVPSAKVTEIERKLRSRSQKREAYLDLYATGHPCPSWRQVAEALHGVGLPSQANTVERTYVQGRLLLLIY